MTYHPDPTDAEPCIRCVEVFTHAGKDVPRYQLPTLREREPEPEPDDDEEDAG